MAIDSKLKKGNVTMDGIKTPLFVGTLFVWHVLYFALFFGLAFINEIYIRWLSTAIQIFICLFLVIRFRPFRDYTITQFDATVIFASATSLLTNVLTTEIFSAYVGSLSNEAKGVFSGKGTITSAPEPTNTSLPTYAPNPTLQNSANPSPSITTGIPLSNSTPDQQQSAKISYYSP
jgi:hypothetical protein